MENDCKLALIGNIPKEEVVCIRARNDDNKVVSYHYIDKSIYNPVVINNESEKAQYHDAVVSVCSNLATAFPQRVNSNAELHNNSLFYGLLYSAIEAKKIPIDRLRDSIANLIATNHYKTFTIADVVDYDKRITLGLSFNSLCEALHRKLLNEQVYITCDIIDGHVTRLYGLKEDISNNPIYKDRILGEWDSDNHCWKWTGHVDDPETEERRKEFKEILFKKYGDKYSEDILNWFFDFYFAIVPPGDRMKFENIHGFKVDKYLKKYQEVYNEVWN